MEGCATRTSSDQVITSSTIQLKEMKYNMRCFSLKVDLGLISCISFDANKETETTHASFRILSTRTKNNVASLSVLSYG